MPPVPPHPEPPGPRAAQDDEPEVPPSSGPPSHILPGPYTGPTSTHAVAAFKAGAVPEPPPAARAKDAGWTVPSLALAALGVMLAAAAITLFVTR